MVNVLLVEDSRISREALESRIRYSENYRLVTSIENAANAEIACVGGKVNLILMDVCTAEDESGLVAAAKIKQNYPDIRIVIMTSMPEHSFMKKARQAGCDGFWYKEFGDEDIVDVCNRVMKGEQVWPQILPVIRIGEADSRDFTERELEVIRELTIGNKYDVIAENLGISGNTVKYHIKNILQKTGFRSTLQLVAEVVDKKLILPKF